MSQERRLIKTVRVWDQDKLKEIEEPDVAFPITQVFLYGEEFHLTEGHISKGNALGEVLRIRKAREQAEANKKGNVVTPPAESGL